MPYTIIAGNGGPRGPRSPFGDDPNDWLVSVEETKVSPADHPIIFQLGHTFMMNDSRVQAAIGNVLKRGAP